MKEHPIVELLKRVNQLFEDWSAHSDSMTRDTLNQLVHKLKTNHDELAAWMERKKLP